MATVKKVYGSVQIPLIIKAMQKAIDTALPDIGNEAVDQLRQNEADYDASHRLRDSFSWATKKRQSGTGPEAYIGDEVEKPTEPNTLVVGTRTPYSASLNYGTVSGFQFGKNGAPDTIEELVDAIYAWIKMKKRNGNWYGDATGYGQDDESLARAIAFRIADTGTDAHPYWEASTRTIRELAKEYIVGAMSEELKKIAPATQLITGKD